MVLASILAAGGYRVESQQSMAQKTAALKELHDSGVLSDQEYQQKLQQLKAGGAPGTSAGPAAGVKARPASGAAPGHVWHMKKVRVDVPHSGYDAMPQYGVSAAPYRDLLAMSMLIPVDWEFRGSPTFPQTLDCNFTVGRISFVAHNKDDTAALISAPVPSTIWSNDRNMLQSIQQTNQQYGKMQTCGIQQTRPLAAALPAMLGMLLKGAQPTGPLEPIKGVSEKIAAMVEQVNQQLNQQGGGNGRAPHIDMQVGRMPVSGNDNGKAYEGYVWAMQMVKTEFGPNNVALQTTDYPLFAASFAPPGQIAQMQPMFDAMADSIQITPEWSDYTAQYSAVRSQILQVVMGNVNASQAAMAADNAKAARDQQAIRTQSQQNRNQVIAGVAANRADALQHSSQQFALHMGDQAIYTDPRTGHSVQMSNQYDHAWASSTGNSNEYILTDSASFDPNGQVGSGQWTQMQQQR